MPTGMPPVGEVGGLEVLELLAELLESLAAIEAASLPLVGSTMGRGKVAEMVAVPPGMCLRASRHG